MKSERVRKDYISRVNRILDYIESNLNKDLGLDVLSEIACFSPFHFHRIFTIFVGETLNQYIGRKRIEKVAAILIANPEQPIGELIYQSGFSSVSSLSRAFKNKYGVSPTQFAKQVPDQFSKIGQIVSKNGEKQLTFDRYICSIDNIKNWYEMNAKIEVKQMPELQIAYIKHVGDYSLIGRAYERLMRWAGPKGLLAVPNMKTITVYHDDPKVTDISKVRQSAGITLEEDVEVDGEIGKMIVESGKFATGRFEIGVTEFEQAWNSMCIWVAENGYSVRDGLYYELYHNDHMDHPERKFILDICIPVK